VFYPSEIVTATAAYVYGFGPAVAYLGSRAETLSTSNPLVWVAVAVLIGLLSSEWLLRRRRRGKGNDDHPAQPSESDRESKGQPEQAVHPAIGNG
jgi:hypothetical protein